MQDFFFFAWLANRGIEDDKTYEMATFLTWPELNRELMEVFFNIFPVKENSPPLWTVSGRL